MFKMGQKCTQQLTGETEVSIFNKEPCPEHRTGTHTSYTGRSAEPQSCGA